MFNFMIQGGIIGMLIITLFGASAIALAIYIAINRKNQKNTSKYLNGILYLGSSAFFAGLLWNAIGLYDILDYIQRIGDVPQTALAGGLKAASVSSIWGLSLFIISYVTWYLFRLKLDNKE